MAASLFSKLIQDGQVSNTLTARAFEVLDRDGDGLVSRADFEAVEGIDVAYWDDLLQLMEKPMNSATFHSILVKLSAQERSQAPAAPVLRQQQTGFRPALQSNQTRVLTYGSGSQLGSISSLAGRPPVAPVFSGTRTPGPSPYAAQSLQARPRVNSGGASPVHYAAAQSLGARVPSPVQYPLQQAAQRGWGAAHAVGAAGVISHQSPMIPSRSPGFASMPTFAHQMSGIRAAAPPQFSGGYPAAAQFSGGFAFRR